MRLIIESGFFRVMRSAEGGSVKWGKLALTDLMELAITSYLEEWEKSHV
jgi:hypothetical protein